MAISGAGGWPPSARVYIYNRQLILQKPFHNVPPEVVWHPEAAAAYFIDNAGASIYVPLSEDGGVQYLYDLLLELGLIAPYTEWNK